MNIALDYDGTFTSDRSLWLRFIGHAQNSGHTVYVVTMRFPSECEELDFQILRRAGCLVEPTSRKAKRPHCEREGIDIHIWIDDYPQAVDLDASEIWPTQAPEGQPVDIHYK
jgi:hypothetical protein